MAKLRATIDTDALKAQHNESLRPCREMLGGMMERLQLKGKNFEVFQPAGEEEISDLWKVLKNIDDTLQVCMCFYLEYPALNFGMVCMHP